MDFELANGVLSRNDDGQVDVADVQGLVLRTLVGKRTSNLVIAPTERILAHRRTARPALGNSRWGNGNQIENISPVERQFVRFALFHDLTERCRFRLQQGRFRSHFDDLGDLADLERSIDVHALLNFDDNRSASVVFETRLLDVNSVLAREQINKCEEAIAPAGLSALLRRAQVGQGDVGIGYGGSRNVRHCAGDRPIGGLRVRVQARRREEESNRQNSCPESARKHGAPQVGMKYTPREALEDLNRLSTRVPMNLPEVSPKTITELLRDLYQAKILKAERRTWRYNRERVITLCDRAMGG